MINKTLKQGSVFVYRAITKIILNGEQVEAVQVEAVTRGRVLFLKISQNSQENNCVGYLF